MGTGVGELALLQAAGVGAATGAATSALTGGDPLKGALIGGLTAGAGHGFAGGASAAGGTQVAASAVPEVGMQSVANPAMLSPSAPGAATGDLLSLAGRPPTDIPLTGMQSMPGVGGAGYNASLAEGVSSVTGITPPTDVTSSFAGSNPYSLTSATPPTSPYSVSSMAMPSAAQASMPSAVTPPVPTPPTPPTALEAFYARNPIAMPAGLGALGATIGAGPDTSLPGTEKYSGPLSRFSYDPRKYRRAASGGLMDTEPARRMAGGGLGSYSDGGQTLKGPGDGMSDSIPASIGGSQPARLADGEFVVPADVVSGLGNGSTDAGARQLYDMMDKIREARTGRTRQAPEINPGKMMPA